MKKVLLLTMFILLFTVGCSNIKNDNIESIINKKISANLRYDGGCTRNILKPHSIITLIF